MPRLTQQPANHNQEFMKSGPLNTFLPAFLIFVSAVQADGSAAGSLGFKSRILPFIKVHCFECHGPGKSKGNINLSTLNADFAADGDLKRWELILKKLQRGEMPPAGEKQPTAADRKAVVKWIDTALRRHIKSSRNKGAVPTTRRLTNFEYQNTLRDLLGIELDLAKYLPDDPAKPYRFNNTAQYLLMGREQWARYEGNAIRAMASVIVDPGKPQVYKARREWRAGGRTNNEIAVSRNRRGSPQDGLKITGWPKTGEYRIRIKASAQFPNAMTEMPLRLVMGYPLAGDIGNAPFKPVGTIRLVAGAQPRVYEFRGRIENHPVMPELKNRRGGTRTGRLRVQPANMTITPQNLFDDGTLNDGVDPNTRPKAVVEWIEFEAPVSDVWPPAHHTRILFASPLRKTQPAAYVREVLKRFLTRAFRRPVTDKEIARYEKIYTIYAADAKSMEEAMRRTLAVVLTSPNFLYHITAKDDAHRHFEIASRLSYFLWGSMPDQQLFDLAAKQRLRDPEVMKSQVQRMLKDRRASDFIRNFTSQWLSIAKVKSVPINTDLFPRFLHMIKRGERSGAEVPFRPTIRDDMFDETVAFVAALIAGNADVSNLVDSNFAMLNQRLAAHYGVDGVRGHRLRRVALKPNHRLGGLLTQGSILVGNSTGSAPHPIYRAVWLREAILGEEVKDPPADVPALSDSVGKSAEKAVTIKDLLRQHRRKASCNQCHARLDPWGIPFERYNAIGRYQPKVPRKGVRIPAFNKARHKSLTQYKAQVASLYTVKVDAAAELPHGPKVDGMTELKRHLLKNRRHDIAANVMRRLLSYGLGRDLTYRDRYDVDELLKQSKKNGYRMRDMIVLICRSGLFLGTKR